jgi:hypothetical protein
VNDDGDSAQDVRGVLNIVNGNLKEKRIEKGLRFRLRFSYGDESTENPDNKKTSPQGQGRLKYSVLRTDQIVKSNPTES